MQQKKASKCRVCAVFWVIILAFNIGILSYFIAWEFMSLKQYRIASAIKDGKRSVVSLEHLNNNSHENLAFAADTQQTSVEELDQLAQNAHETIQMLQALEPSGAPMHYADTSLAELEADIMLEAKINPLLDTASILRPTITVIIADLGISDSTTELAFSLPSHFTLGFSPYASNLYHWIDKANKEGHPIVLQLPMQSSHYPADNPGPYGLLNHLSPLQNSKKLDKLFTLTEKPLPVYTPNDEVITSDNDIARALIEKLRQHNVPIIYGSQQNNAFIQQAEDAELSLTKVDFVIDDVLSDQAIKRQLKRAQETAEYQGHVTILGHAYPLTIAVLEEWSQELDNVALLGYGIPKSTLNSPRSTAGSNTNHNANHASY